MLHILTLYHEADILRLRDWKPNIKQRESGGTQPQFNSATVKLNQNKMHVFRVKYIIMNKLSQADFPVVYL